MREEHFFHFIDLKKVVVSIFQMRVAFASRGCRIESASPIWIHSTMAREKTPAIPKTSEDGLLR